MALAQTLNMVYDLLEIQLKTISLNNKIFCTNVF